MSELKACPFCGAPAMAPYSNGHTSCSSKYPSKCPMRRVGFAITIEEWQTRPAPERHNELREALELARQVLVTACGETAPYIKIALQKIDAALAEQAAPVKQTSALRERLIAEIEAIICAKPGRLLMDFPEVTLRRLLEKSHAGALSVAMLTVRLALYPEVLHLPPVVVPVKEENDKTYCMGCKMPLDKGANLCLKCAKERWPD